MQFPSTPRRRSGARGQRAISLPHGSARSPRALLAVAAAGGLLLGACAPATLAHDAVTGRLLTPQAAALPRHAQVETPYDLYHAAPGALLAGDSVVRWSVVPAASGAVTGEGIFLPWKSGRVVLVGQTPTRRVTLAVDVDAPSVESVRFDSPLPETVHVGDTVRIAATVKSTGAPATPAYVLDQTLAPAATLVQDADGARFVARAPGIYAVLAVADHRAARQTIFVEPADERPVVAPVARGSAVDGDSLARRGVAMLAPVSVVASPYVSLDLTDGDAAPYAGTVLPLRAIARDANGREHDVTSRVSWSASDTAVAAVDAAGRVDVRDRGRVVIDATLGQLTAHRRLVTLWHPAADLAMICSTGRHVLTVGERVHCHVDVWARGATPVKNTRLAFAVAPVDGQPADAATITPDGDFRASRPGLYRVFVVAGDLADMAFVQVAPATLAARK